MMSWPVVNAAPGELSQSTALAISSGVPMRPTGFCVAVLQLWRLDLISWLLRMLGCSVSHRFPDCSSGAN